MQRAPSPVVRLFAVLAVIAATSATSRLQAQDVSLGIATIHDENIFDVYLPFPDQLTQLLLDASRDWDLDNTTYGISYSGSGMLFRELASRNYHTHLLTLTASHHFTSEEEDGGEDPDAATDDSTGAHAATASSSAAEADSLDRFLYGSLLAGSQFNKEAFAEYDNTTFAARVSLRQPLGRFGSATPSYAISYHEYQHLAPITNIQHLFSLTFGGTAFPGAWLSIAPAFAIKSYPTTSTYAITVSSIQSSGNGSGGQGHGKGNGSNGSGGSVTTRVSTFTATTPSVRQFLVTMDWEQKLSSGTRVSLDYSRFGNPSSGARLIPQQLQNVMDGRQQSDISASQNEIFDDHFAYRGDELQLRVEQALPLALAATAEVRFQGKTFTSPAMDLSDSVQLAEHREDDRAELGLNLSRPVLFGGRTLKPQLEIHFIRNRSNAPFYDFEKSTVLIGIEYAF